MVLGGCPPPVLGAALAPPCLSWEPGRPGPAPVLTAPPIRCWRSRAPPPCGPGAASPRLFPQTRPPGPQTCHLPEAKSAGRAGAPSSQGWPWSPWVLAARDLGTRWAHHRCRSLLRAAAPQGSERLCSWASRKVPWPQTPPWTQSFSRVITRPPITCPPVHSAVTKQLSVPALPCAACWKQPRSPASVGLAGPLPALGTSSVK